jgi:class 3 adenylate cyclase
MALADTNPAVLVPRWLPDSIDNGSTIDGEALVLSIDLAGFTTLSEDLGLDGPVGTERLIECIETIFAPLVDAAYDSGGDLLGYGGDALLLGLPPHAHTLAESLAASAHQLTTSTGLITTARRSHQLNTRVGVARGTVTVTTSGTNARKVLVTTGHATSAAVDAQSNATNGTTLWDVDAPTDLSTNQATETQWVDGPRPMEYVDEVVANRLEVSGRQFLSEHRHLTAMFVRFADAPMSQQLDEISAVMELLQLTGGEVLNVDATDKGTVLIAVFGAPVAHHDDPVRALRTATMIADNVSGCQMGVASGTCFVGIIGGHQRGVYTAIGDTVNTAARLMAKAEPGRALVDPNTRRLVAGFEFGKPIDMTLKGRLRPIQVAPLIARRSAEQVVAPQGRFVGRTALMATIDRLVADAARSVGRLVSVVGDAGSGRTRLADELGNRYHHIHCVSVSLDSIERAKPWELWRTVLASLPSSAAQANALGRSTRGTTGLLSDEAASAADVLDGGVVAVEQFASSGAVVVVDNAHSMDAASLTVLSRMAGLLGRVGLVMVLIHDGSLSPRLTINADELVPLTLDALSHNEATSMLRDRLGDEWTEALSEQLIGAVGTLPLALALAGDNYRDDPLLTNNESAPHGDQRAHRSGHADQALLGGGLMALAQAKVDGLDEQSRHVSRHGAVMGRRFAPNELAGVFSVAADEASVSTLTRRGVITVEGFGRVAFSSELLQRVSYDSLLVAKRGELHAMAGDWLKGTQWHGDEDDPLVMSVAHHFARTDRVDDRSQFAVMAGRQARRSFDYEQSRQWIEAASRDLEADRLITLELGEIMSLAGDPVAALEQFDRVIADGDIQLSLRGRLRRIEVIASHRSFTEAADELEALGTLDVPELELERLRIGAYLWSMIGEFERSRTAAHQVIELATQLNRPTSNCAVVSTLREAQPGSAKPTRPSASSMTSSRGPNKPASLLFSRLPSLTWRRPCIWQRQRLSRRSPCTSKLARKHSKQVIRPAINGRGGTRRSSVLPLETAWVPRVSPTKRSTLTSGAKSYQRR